MKRFFSIAFINILLLNVMGYYAVFLGLQYQHDIAMDRALDANQYRQSESFTIKIPVSIPYMINRTDFERVDGKFEYRGEHYRMVKQKFDNDTLAIICVRDNERKRITEAFTDYVTTFADTPPSSGARSKIALNFIKDFLSRHFSLGNTSSGWQADVTYCIDCKLLTPSYTSSLTHPPERG